MVKGTICQTPMKIIFKVAILLFALAGASLPARAQLAVPPPMPAYQPLSGQQLDQLLGPIALYPDPLIAQILPASTFPTEIVMANRYVSDGGDPNAIDQQPWDVSVQALARYPNILQWMDQNLEWTSELGQAFLNQQPDVMDSIQRLRQSAYNLGNLQSTPQQQVINDGGSIEILPAEPQVIYVPVYQPDEVYYQGGFGLSFSIGFPIGLWLSCDFDWHHHHLIEWSRDHPRPPDWWHERPDRRDADIGRQTTVWRREDHPGYRDTGAANRGDRGWNHQPVAHPVTPTVHRPEGHPTMPAAHPPETRSAPPQNVTITAPHVNTPRPTATPREAAVPNRPAPVQHYQIKTPTSTGAFIGIQSSQQTKAYSDRGRQSVPPVTSSAPPAAHSAPPAHSAPVSHPTPSSGGGGGGSRGGGSPPRH